MLLNLQSMKTEIPHADPSLLLQVKEPRAKAGPVVLHFDLWLSFFTTCKPQPRQTEAH